MLFWKWNVEEWKWFCVGWTIVDIFMDLTIIIGRIIADG